MTFSRLILAIVFLFGSVFSCWTSVAEGSTPMIHAAHGEQLTQHDCCPKDGHKKQIETKETAQVIQKQSLITKIVLKISSRIQREENKNPQNRVSLIVHYTSPPIDRESLFFRDTIRLLL